MNGSVTFAWVQVYVVVCPAVSVPIVFAQFGDSGSVTVTFVRVTGPVFVTVIVKVAVPPGFTDCDGPFVIAIEPFR